MATLWDFNYALGAGFAVVGTVLSEGHTGNVFSFFGGAVPCGITVHVYSMFCRCTVD